MTSPAFRGSRLRLIRELRGLTKTELGRRVDRTPGAISHLESERHSPDASTLNALALCLEVPSEFFLKRLSHRPLELSECNFRSLRAASQGERRRVVASGTLLRECAALLEKRVQLPPVAIAADGVQPGESVGECAWRVRRALGLGGGPILEVTRLLEHAGVIVAFIPRSCERVDAFSCWHAGRPFVFLTDSSPSRVRFDAAHELGHLVCHPEPAPSSRAREREADEFAAAFLTPAESFLAHWGRARRVQLERFIELKQFWGVSVACLVRRAHDLGCIGRATYQRLFREISIRGWRSRKDAVPEPAEVGQSRPTLLKSASQLVPESEEILASAIGLRPSDVRELLDGGD